MMRRNQNTILLTASLIVFIVITFLYINNKFVLKNEKIESIELCLNKPYAETSPIIYIIDKNDIGFDFAKPYRGKVLNDSIIFFNMENQLGIRKIRFYFEKKIDELTINKITFNTLNDKRDIELASLIEGNNMHVLNKQESNFIVNVQTNNDYLEVPKYYFYPNDKISLVKIFCGVLIVLSALFFLFKKLKLFTQIKIPRLADFSIILFLISIYLPHPIFNITLIFSVLVVIKNFNYKNFISDKINIIFISYFLLLFLNDLFITKSGYSNLKSTETYLPLLILPIYISCIKNSKLLICFPISAIIMGIGLFLTSIADATIFMNLDYFSFNEFSKFTHPVYFSYLLSFSIFYVLLFVKMDRFQKNIVQVILFLFLILAGSKMVITLTLFIYAVLFVKSKTAIIVMLSGIIFLIFFPPVQNRFKEILNIDDLSIVNDKIITNNNDPRVNGLTLRLLLWQESINVVETIPEYIFGLGVGNSSNDMLKANLAKRGLSKYDRFSTHNQFINIFMRAGFLGLFMLLLIVVYGFYQAIRSKNKILLITVVIFTFAMLTESVLQRVLGIYFFTTVLLFLMKPNFIDEDSNNWDKRDS
jgi:hypothetical protein